MPHHCPHCGGEINAAALLGSAKTEKKAASSRANGMRGGRTATTAEIDQEPSKPFDPNGPEVERVYLPEPKPKRRKKGSVEEQPQEIQVEAPATPRAKIIASPERPPTIEQLSPKKYTGETCTNFGRLLYEIEDEGGRKSWTVTPPPKR